MERFQLKLGFSCQKLPLTLFRSLRENLQSNWTFPTVSAPTDSESSRQLAEGDSDPLQRAPGWQSCRTTQNYKSKYKKPVESEIVGFVFFSKWNMCWDSIERLSSPRRSHHDHENSRALRPQEVLTMTIGVSTSLADGHFKKCWLLSGSLAWTHQRNLDTPLTVIFAWTVCANPCFGLNFIKYLVI